MIKILKSNCKHILFISYMVIAVILTILHEPWRDEAQAWLIARDLSFFDIIKQMQYEGHPCLWHLILVPFAKVGLPFNMIYVINLLFMFVSVWIIIYKTDISNKLKVLIVFSAPFIYYYTAIARSYSLMCLLMLLVIVMYEKRKEKPIIFGIILLLLTNTHVIVAAFTGMIFLNFYVKEIFINKNKDKKVLIGALISLLGFILLIFQLYSSLQMCSIRDISEQKYIIDKIYEYFMKILEFFYLIAQIEFLKNEFVLSVISVIIALFVISFILCLPKEKNSEIITFWISVMYILFVSVFIYCNSEHRSGIIILLLLFLCINYKGKYIKRIHMITIVICIMSIFSAIQYSYFEIKNQYSCAKSTAEYIIENCSENSTLVSDTPDMNLAIIPYLNSNTKFYNLKTSNFFTYTTWNYDVSSDIVEEEIKEKIEKLDEKQNVYYIHSFESYNLKNNMASIIDNLEEEGYLEKIYDNYIYKDNIMTDETYVIYKIKGIEYDK